MEEFESLMNSDLNGLWVARIKFRQKSYYLGSYAKLEDAAKARARGEETVYEAFLSDIDLAEIPLKKNSGYPNE